MSLPAALSGWSRAALTSLSAKPPPEKINRGPNHKDENQWLPHDRACPLKRAAEILGAGSRRSPGPPETERVGLSGPQVGGFADPVSRSLTKRRRVGDDAQQRPRPRPFAERPPCARPWDRLGEPRSMADVCSPGVPIPGGPGRVDPKLGLSRAGTCRRPRVSGRGKGQPESGLEG